MYKILFLAKTIIKGNNRNLMEVITVTGAVLYIMARQKVESLEDDITLEKVASIFCEDPVIKAKANSVKVYKFRKNGKTKVVISIVKIIELLTKSFPGIKVESLGENAIILERIHKQKHEKTISYFKIAFVAAISLIGTAFTIMAFHNDVQISSVFTRTYRIITGQESDGFTVLEVAYAIGLFIGIMVFYNHIGGKKLSKDPTPLEVEMKVYERDVNMMLAETAEREGQEIDVD